MKIESVTELAIPGVKLIRFGAFGDDRGYFTEPYRESQLQEVIPGFHCVQTNQSRSKPNVLRGLHFQWHPFMGKLVRVLSGSMVDIVADIRVGSPTFGQGLQVFMSDLAPFEWIWVPPGMAHGNYFLGETVIEYLCTGEYSQGNEACISPFDIVSWLPSVDGDTREHWPDSIISVKDRAGISLAEWCARPDSQQFTWETAA